MTPTAGGAIDIVVLPFTPETKRGPYERTQALKESMILFGAWDKEFTAQELVAEMDEAGVAKAFLCAQAGGTWEVSYDYIAGLVAPYAGRLYGLAGVDPHDIAAGLRRLQAGVHEYGFVGAHSYPHWFGIPPDDRVYYPFYAKCIELDIPIEIQVGQAYQRTLVGVGVPGAIDRVAVDFPELRIIGIHTAYPWEREMIAVAWKHPNVFIGVDNKHPSEWSPDLVSYIRNEGRGKVLWGTNKPAVQPAASLEAVRALDFGDEVENDLTYRNAERVFKLGDP
jgi:predicted TIM-barrel fold metal-dependent hydrolase